MLILEIAMHGRRGDILRRWSLEMVGRRMVHAVPPRRTPIHRPTPRWWRRHMGERRQRWSSSHIHWRSTRWWASIARHVPSAEIIIWPTLMHPAPSHRPSHRRWTPSRHTKWGRRATPGWPSSHHVYRWWTSFLMERGPVRSRSSPLKSSRWRATSAHVTIGWRSTHIATSSSKSRIIGPTRGRPVYISREASFHV